jgi:ABC-type Fe3+/spermidine/putrescine transport system ATPase subunit
MPASGTTSPTPGTAPSSAAGEAIRLDGVTFGYGPTPAVRGVSLAIPRGEFVSILGPSGCGKTTLLKLIGGYLTPTAGRVHLRGGDATADPPERRAIGTVFQNYALFPHLTARRNVAFGLEVRGVPKARVRERVEVMLDRVGLDRAERDRHPANLSGGQQQRVALARALAFGPDVLLLDEPLANLDRHLRDRMRAELRRLHEASGVTTVMVTHDQSEAVAASDRIAVMDAGRVLQVGSPREVYDRPNSVFVAEFLGEANLFDGGLVGRPGRVVMVRPERCVIDQPADHVWGGRVEAVADHGAEVVVRIGLQVGSPRPGGSRRTGLAVRTRYSFAPGQPVAAGFPDSAVWEIPGP